MNHDLPTPEQIMEELASKVMVQIDRLAPVAFDATLDEMVRYHRFLLSLNAGRDVSGAPLNYAEIAIGFFPRQTHLQWLQQYNRLFERAAHKLGEDQDFIYKLALVPMRLLPGPDDPEPTPAITGAMLDLIATLVHRLEGWVTKRTVIESREGQEASPRIAMAASDHKAYESVLPRIVGAWEQMLQWRPPAYRWKDRPGNDDAGRWSAFAGSWEYLSRHLQNTVYMLAVAVWNEDETGARLFREALIRWPENLQHEIGAGPDVVDHCLLYPDLLTMEWPQALEHAQPILPRALHRISPAQLFNTLLLGIHKDCLLLTIALLVHWQQHEKLASDIGTRTAAALLRREAADDTEDYRALNRFSEPFGPVFMDFLRIHMAGGRFTEEGHGEALDRLVRTLDGMSERSIVPGRIFTPSTLQERHGLYPAILALLLSLAPVQGDVGLTRRLGEIAENEAALPDGDLSLRNLLQQLRSFSAGLTPPLTINASGLGAINSELDLDASAASLRKIIDDGIEAIEAVRRRRLQEMPVDMTKIERLRTAIEKSLLTRPSAIPSFFRHPALRKERTESGERHEVRFNIEKAHLVAPPMEFEVLNFEDSITQGACMAASTNILRSFTRRQRGTLKLDFPVQDVGFWTGIKNAVPTVGLDPVLLVSRTSEGSALFRHFIYVHGERKPPVEVERKADLLHVESYIATIENVDVYGIDLPPGVSWLLSSRILNAVTYHALGARDRFVELHFESEDGIDGALVARYSQSSTWEDSPVLEIHLPASEGQTDNATSTPIDF